MALRQRLLRDISELQTKPYPNIKLIPYEDDISKACLILRPNSRQSLHLTVRFGDDYPLNPPVIEMQSRVHHPNVLRSYVCASILNTREGYTTAYTMKGIAIQLLSFFSSDNLEQDYGATYSLKDFRRPDGTYTVYGQGHRCSTCRFENDDQVHRVSQLDRSRIQHVRSLIPSGMVLPTISPGRRRGNKPKQPEVYDKKKVEKEAKLIGQTKNNQSNEFLMDNDDQSRAELTAMPDEILLNICEHLEVEDLAPFARSWDRIGSENGVVTKYNIIRNRELICFCLKKSFETCRLGVGVHVALKGRQGTLESEFDLLSYQAFHDFNLRTSVQGLPFQHWVPLAISRKHYVSIRHIVETQLRDLGQAARLSSTSPHNVLYSFMNDIVVKLSSEVNAMSDKSSLGRASEKAIESYYQLFHLLLCLATEQPEIVHDINLQLQGVLQGRTHKNEIPNLGHLLITILISDADMTDDLLMAIIRETVVRNVVWMLDRKGAGMAELAYMEADSVSVYRLQKTFEASLTSYRLLMFLNLFRRTISRGTPGQSKKSLVQLRDELFDAHGAPPRSTASRLATDIRALQQVDSFPKFLRIMGLKTQSASQFTSFLRDCLEASVEKGYSIWGITQARALTLRQRLDPNVKIRAQEDEKKEWFQKASFQAGFFPNRGGGTVGGGGRGDWRGGRGGRSGRGH